MTTMTNSTSDVPEITFGLRLEAALRHGHLTVSELAEELGVSRSTISRWLNDRANKPPRAAYLRSMASRCGVSYDWLRDGEVPTTGRKPRGSRRHIRSSFA